MIEMKSEYYGLKENQGTWFAYEFMCGQYDCCILVWEWNWIVMVDNRSMCSLYDGYIVVLQ